MAGVFDIDLDQPEEAGSDEELEEGVRAAAGPGRERGRPRGLREGGRGRRRRAGRGPRWGGGGSAARPQLGPGGARTVRAAPGHPRPERAGAAGSAAAIPAELRCRERGTGSAAGFFLIISVLSHVRTSVRECRSFWSRVKSLLSRQNQKARFETLR